MVYWVIYGVVALLIVAGCNAYPAWKEGLGERLSRVDADDWHIAGTVGGVLWPLVIVAVPAMYAVFWLFGKIRQGIVELGKFYKMRRDRIALAEREAKRIADERRYEVERGPHR
jgi:hypothetical protein